jgi:tetratricopeptide (TPR) repeat protein
MYLSPSELRVIDDLQESNLNLQAFTAARKFGSFREWEGTDALITASHLAYSLGAPEQSFWLTSRAWHRDKSNSKAIFYYAAELMQKRGPLPTLMFMRRFPDPADDAKLTSWWYSLYGQIHGGLRDFSIADKWHSRAEHACPSDPWVWVSRAFTLEQQDRYEEALEAATHGLELGPTRRSTVASVAHFLTLLERDLQAIDLLSSTVTKVENAWLLKDLSDLQTELGMHAEAYQTLEGSFDLLPMLEDKVGEWLYGGLSDLAHLNGDREKAIEFASKVSNEFHKKVTENLKAAPADAKRKVLNVGFLRQHHVTCAPATISNIARYWQKNADHLEIVEKICYDGTPSYKERIWAETNGWKTREFTLNWNDAVGLLDAGVPMTLATVHPGGGHLQAIIGYDEARGTFLVRDPYFRRTCEFLAKELMEQQLPNGPRVMALAPVGWNDELFENGWSESEIYDLAFRVDSALEDHLRDDAEAARDQLEREYPGHRLSHVSNWSAAAYDANTLGIRSAMQNLLEKFPEDVNLRLSDLSISSEFTGRSERLAKLEDYSRAEKSDPLIWQMFGYELSLDAKQHRRAIKWLFRSLRRYSSNGLTVKFLADLLWAQRRYDEATDLYRIASSLNDKDEQFAYSYFLAMRFLKREEEVLAALDERATRFAKQSSMPVRSLFAALRQLDRVSAGFEKLDDGIRALPEDGDLKLFAAEMRARYGQFDAAEDLITAAKPQSSNSRWLRARAFVLQLKGDLSAALEDWRKIAASDPSALDAHENIAFLVKGIDGGSAAKEYLRKVCRKFPSNRGLQTLRLSYLNEEPAEAIAALRDLLRRDPADVWGLRELSYWYFQVNRMEDALKAAEQAVAVDPNDPTSHWFHGRALEMLKQNSEAAESFRTSLGLSVDNTHSIQSWLAILRTVDAKRNALSFIWTQLNEQAAFGDGLIAYRYEARRVLDRVTLLTQLQEFAGSNRRSWFAASALIQQLAEMGKSDEALTAANDATQRFPLSRQIWLDLALVHKMRGRWDEAIEALKTAVTVDPVWSYSIQQLADAYQVAGRFAESRDSLLEGLTRLPFDSYLLGYLADAYWNLGEKDKAIETAKKAVMIEPEYDWAWSSIKRWAVQMGDRELPVNLARELTERKPKDLRAWTNLAEMLDNGVYSDERSSVIEKALELDPANAHALALKANLLTDARRFDEAIEVTKTKLPDGHRPEQLRFIEASIEMMRSRPTRCVDILIELTESSPGYLPGWSRLADLYRTDPNRAQEYRKTAMEMVRLAPRDATAFGYLAEACLQLELKDDAKEALLQAVILQPEYAYAVDNLFDLYVKDDDVAPARDLVERVCGASPATGLPIAVEWAVKRKDREKAVEYISRLMQEPNVDRYRLNRVFERVFELFDKKDRSVLDALDTAAKSGDAHPAVGRFLIEASHKVEKLKVTEKRLAEIDGNIKVWSFAASRYLEILASEKPTSVAKFIDTNAENLRIETESWGAVGYQLSNLTDLRRADKWYEGWERRSDVMPWMLWNYSIILRRNGHSEVANGVNSASLNLQPDDTINLHLTSLGLTEFSRRNFSSATSLLAQINVGAMTTWDRFHYDVLNDAVNAIGRLGEGDQESAASLIESIAALILYYDPKASDRMTQDLAKGALYVLLDEYSSKWLSFKIKAKLMYYRLG